MNIADKVIDILKGMEGIGGLPTDKEFLDEFEFRLQALKPPAKDSPPKIINNRKNKKQMKPKQFKEATVELKKPASMTDEECGSLFIHQSERGECISLWTAPFWQRLKFLFHGILWLGVLSGKTQPPVWLDMTPTVFIKKDK